MPLVLLGLNNSISDDSNFSAAQIVYSRQLAIPNCIFDKHFDLADYSLLERIFTRNSAYVPRELRTCAHVWLQRGTSASNLQRPYAGPYKVFDRNCDNHTMRIFIDSHLETVAMERVKPAFGIPGINVKLSQPSDSTVIASQKHVHFQS